MSLRIAMMGTGTFALPTFRALIESPHEVVGLATQPDREHRGKVHPHPMKELAVEHSVPVLQPDNVNTPESLAALRELGADIFVVAAYGQILSAELLGIPRLGAINLHGSLLPKYRGAAPIQYAVLKGEAETGVTIFQIEPRLDAGPCYGVVRTPIGPKETSGDVHDRLAELAVPLTLDILDQLEAGTCVGQPQEQSGVTKAPKIPKELGLINWSRTSREVDCQIRAMQPWPMAYTFLKLPDGRELRLLVLDIDAIPNCAAPNVAPGTVVESPAAELHVRTGDGVVAIRMLQPSGKRAMPAAEFLRGNDVQPGAEFGAPSD